MFVPVLTPSLTRTELGAAWAVPIDGINAIIGFYIPRLPAIALLLVAIRRRLFTSIGRLDRLIARWQANTLPRPRPSRAGKPRTQTAPRPDRPRHNTRRFWLVKLVQPTAQYQLHIANLLARPDTRALVEAAPQAGRFIRPLCRAFDIAQPDWLKLPPRPRKPRPAPEPKPEKPVRQTLPPGYLPGMLPTDRPLPKRIIDAVRWEKKRGLWKPA